LPPVRGLTGSVGWPRRREPGRTKLVEPSVDSRRRRPRSHDLERLFDSEPASPIYVAINRVLVRNDPELVRMMKQASAKMCLATALTPGFRGFDLMRQVGTCPMGMRWAASSDTRDELSHVWIDQFTYMEDMKDSSGSKLRRTAEVWEGYTLPAEYLVMVRKRHRPRAGYPRTPAIGERLHTERPQR
jgi:hypothetical protein